MRARRCIVENNLKHIADYQRFYPHEHPKDNTAQALRQPYCSGHVHITRLLSLPADGSTASIPRC